MKYQAGLIER